MYSWLHVRDKVQNNPTNHIQKVFILFVHHNCIFKNTIVYIVSTIICIRENVVLPKKVIIA